MEMQQLPPPTSIAPFGPMPAVARILSRFDRDQLEAFVAVAIDLMDVADGDPDGEIEDPAGETVPVIDDPDLPPVEDDGDPDLEVNGDELDGTAAEDDFYPHSNCKGEPGCPIADPDLSIEDADQGCGVGDLSYAEWHTLPASTRRAGGIEGKSRDDWARTIHEDDEDDDGGGDCTEDEPGFDPRSRAQANLYDEGAGCAINGDREWNGDEADYGGEVDGI